MEPWYDTHVHLDRYGEAERIALLERAVESEVAMVVVGMDVDSSRTLAALPGTAGSTAGVHPLRTESFDERQLREAARLPGVVAIGECGFDAAGPSWEQQAAAFQAQCHLAGELRLPLVLHIDGAGAWEAFASHLPATDVPRVIRHYFTGDAAQAAWHAEHGHFLSFGNPLRRSPALRDIARSYPAELLLIETDSYPLPGRNTEPAHVAKVGETLALLRDWTFADARQHLARNTRAAFPRMKS